MTPVVKLQSGAPYGRFFQTRTGELNYGAQIILAEPIGTRRQDTVAVIDFRVEKQLRFAADRAKLGLFFDLFNAMNSQHRGEHRLALGRRLREGDDGPRTAHRQVRREVRLVGRVEVLRSH